VINQEYSDEEEGVKKYYLQSVELGKNPDFSFPINKDDYVKKYGTSVKAKWIYEYNEKTEYSNENIKALYFTEEFSSKKLKGKYGQMVQYSECLIDTTSQIFSENAKYSGVRYFDTLPNKISKFNDYVAKILKRPEFDSNKFEIIMGLDTMSYGLAKKKLSKKELAEREKQVKILENEFEIYRTKIGEWESLRLTRLDSLSTNDLNFMPLLKDALAEAKDLANSDDEFEEFVARYVSKNDALQLKRNRRVVGGCSMDSSPRYHAFNIALLSAETTKWDVFLKSHLNIMNVRFNRV